ncbi:hypothetical protein BHYA_0309g00150 [Botrytis hyacinthi]|uniref:Uncharacterized protein n=1 Tax=Botrytis hyacinthi TaxID=278943 RepID=A0A4Z1GFB3_9HELO|nr:hypothetical protein BHYA_0309g00150 [Botrytis hyacinthi]
MPQRSADEISLDESQFPSAWGILDEAMLQATCAAEAKVWRMAERMYGISAFELSRADEILDLSALTKEPRNQKSNTLLLELSLTIPIGMHNVRKSLLPSSVVQSLRFNAVCQSFVMPSSWQSGIVKKEGLKLMVRISCYRQNRRCIKVHSKAKRKDLINKKTLDWKRGAILQKRREAGVVNRGRDDGKEENVREQEEV